ncbi:hypothetical protein FPOAC1_001698 [Fusarium poae]|uniref:hypothetical protein n=1 Tax=Fusarium poae TaxID=36050 RepID=UPI001CEAE1B7|nr:hypothetical protein FPOAC1_001698 [Fusarium poae]KAG8675710.1 hypothetical protein FPOAC1_001698 [Fusarium poae]
MRSKLLPPGVPRKMLEVMVKHMDIDISSEGVCVTVDLQQVIGITIMHQFWVCTSWHVQTFSLVQLVGATCKYEESAQVTDGIMDKLWIVCWTPDSESVSIKFTFMSSHIEPKFVDCQAHMPTSAQLGI